MKHVSVLGPRGPFVLLIAAALQGGTACADDSGAPPAAAEAVAAPVARITVEGPALAELKRRYLACEEEATQRVLDAGTAARCSLTYEALLRDAFGGRFEDLRAWWQRAVAMP
jgi:hypothetical protein